MTRYAPRPRNQPAGSSAETETVLAEGATDFFGTTIPISGGRRMIVGVPLWTSDIAIRGEGDSQTRTVSFAMGFGYNLAPADELITVTLTRLWFNESLVMDRTSTSGPAYNPDIKVTFYPGSETQGRDPTIKRALGASKTPGFRGMIYAVFKGLPLHRFGLDRVPFVRAEFQDMTEDVSYVLEMDRLASSLNHPGDEQNDVTAVDWGRARFFTFVDDSGVGGDDKIAISVHDLDSNAMIATNRIKRSGAGDVTDRQIANGPVAVFPDSGHVMIGGVGGTIIVVDPMSGVVKGRTSIWSTAHMCTFPMRAVWLDGDDLGVQYLAAISRFASAEDSIRVLLYERNAGGETYQANVGGGHKETVNSLQTFFATFFLDNDVRGMAGGELIALDVLQSNPLAVGGGVFYAICERSIYRIFVPYRPFQEAGDRVVVSGQEFQYKASPNLLVSKFWTNPSSSYINDYVFFDAASEDAIVLYHHTGTGQRYIARVRHPRHGRPTRNNTASVVEETVAGDVEYEGKAIPSFTLGILAGWAQSDIDAGTLCYKTSSELVIVNLADGSYVTFSEAWRYLGDVSNQPGDINFNVEGAVWSSRLGCLIGRDGFDWSKIYVGRAPEGQIQLADLLRWFLLKAGYAEDQISISGVDDLVYGSIIKSRVPVPDLLNDMGRAFAFDWYESEGVIKIRKKGTGTSFAIDLELDGDDLAWLGGGEARTTGDDRAALVTRQNAEDEPPNAVDLKYLNIRANYSVDIARAKRPSFPVDVSNSVSVAEIVIPVVLAPPQAGLLAIRALYRMWTNRRDQEFRLPLAHAAVEPTDIIKITRAGFEHVVKVVQAMFEGDKSISVLGENYVTDDDVAIDADDPLDLPQEPIMPSFCSFYWIDTPRLDYLEDHVSTRLLHYTAITSRGQAGWTGGTLYQSFGAGFGEVYRNAEDSPCAGLIQNVPAVPGGGGVLQDDIELTLVVTVGDAANLEAKTELELRADSNMAFWGRPGRWEIMQFGAIEETDNGAILTQIVRGRRGTEWAMGLHEEGDDFIVAELAIRPVNLPFEQLGNIVANQVIGDRLDADSSPVTQEIVSANARKCFAPTMLAAVLDGSDIDLSWERRTRYLSELVDSVDDTPLDEAAEEYELEILDTLGDVVRTVTALTAPAYTYAAANIATDFGATPTVLTFRVYQIGGVVGRGFPGQRTVDVL